MTWLRTNKEDEELRGMRAEAEELIGQKTEIKAP
jgi:hypothetical protein